MKMLLKRYYFFLKSKKETILKKIEVRNLNVQFFLNCTIDKKSQFEGANRIGEFSIFSGQMGYGTYIGENSRICGKVGRYCSIAADVRVLSGTHPSKIFVSTSPVFYSLQKSALVNYSKIQRFEEYKKVDEINEIIIGNDVWISSGVRIIGGIKIGDGAIIAANSVVTKDVEPYTIIGGVPAKKIKYRFTKEQIEYLLQYKWWDKPEEWLKNNVDLFENIENFIEKTK